MYYKWEIGADTFCARVTGSTANYYKNGEVYALYQNFLLKESDIKITEKEFNTLLYGNK